MHRPDVNIPPTQLIVFCEQARSWELTSTCLPSAFRLTNFLFHLTSGAWALLFWSAIWVRSPSSEARTGMLLLQQHTHFNYRTASRGFNLSCCRYWDIMNKIVNDEPPTFPPGCAASPQMCEFVACCLKKDPSERATVSQLMEHPWMQMHCAGHTSERKREHISVFLRDLRSVFVTNRSNSPPSHPFSFFMIIQDFRHIFAGARATS